MGVIAKRTSVRSGDTVSSALAILSNIRRFQILGELLVSLQELRHEIQRMIA